MADPSNTHHHRAMEHLRTATKALERHRAAVELAAKEHLDTNPVVAPTLTITDAPTSKDATSD